MSCARTCSPFSFFAQAVEKRQLLGGIEPFQPPLFNDLFQPFAQRLIEGWVFFHADVDLVTDGVLHLARLRLVSLERIDLLFKLRREKLDLRDQDLNAVRDYSIGNQLPHFLAAARQVEPVIPVAGTRGSTNLSQPAQIGVIREGTLVRQ